MSESSLVALVYCDHYETESVEKAVRQGIELLGGAGQFAHAGEKILVKPNILVGSDAEKCVSPHPSVFRAVLKQFLETGASLSFGDSPGFGSPRAAARAAGLLQEAEALAVPLAEFSNGKTVSFLEGNLIKQFTIACGVLESDGIISLGKMKSHGLTRITGAIKNQFGCIPGLAKPEFHSRLPTARLFSQMLVDLNRFLKPRLYIIDGIVAMEGNGPRNGTPRPMHVLLFSTDPVALDATMCRMIGLDENLVDPIVFGNQYGLGNSRDVQLVGEPLEKFLTLDFKVDRIPSPAGRDLGMGSSRAMRDLMSPKPVIDPALCTKCGNCVQICPADPKAVNWKNGKTEPPEYNYQNCIRCYCCQELCPQGAITVKVPLLGRLIHH